MNCPNCFEYTELITNDDGTYELWCDCGYHTTITDEKQEQS